MMRRSQLLVLPFFLGVSVLLCGCSNSEAVRPPSSSIAPRFEVSSPTSEAGPPAGNVSRLIEDALESEGNVTYDQLLERLGSPAETKTEAIPNQYVENQVDTLRTLIYTGLRALVYDVTGETRTFLVRLTISSTQYTTPEGVRVGAREERVLEMLGPPTSRNQSRGELIYQESGTTPTSMVVRIQDGQVVQIGWEFYFA